jgi:predicted nucleic acid-binding protein
MTLTKLENIAAVLDANVLYQAPLRDYLLHLAKLKVYDPVWTDTIQEEWVRNLLKARPDINRASPEATQRSMDRNFPESKLKDYESIIESFALPDPDDRHVLAAAIKRKAQVIVTANLKRCGLVKSTEILRALVIKN